MTVSVTLPKMGESVVEGTIIRWLKNEGEYVAEDEPIVEISTDKIDTELPSPASGVLTRIVVGPDQTVEVGAELAVIDEQAEGDGKAAAPEKEQAAPQERAAAKQTAAKAEEVPERVPERPAAVPDTAVEEQEEQAAPEPTKPSAPAKQAQPAAKPAQPAAQQQQAAPDGRALSPLVRKLARERGVDLATVQGSGPGGRITKDDVLAAAEGGAPAAPAAATQAPKPAARAAAAPASVYATPSAEHEDVAFTRIRQAIAEHMKRSLDSAAQLTNVVEVDMTAVAELRNRAKDAFKQTEGFSLTFMPFIAQATVSALRTFPELNAHILEDGKTARLYRQVNLGIAVGRDEGLIVPIVHGADGMNLIGLARAIYDVAERARTKGGLKPDDVTGGTFSITNYGSAGALADTPIISQPQVAILGVGAIVKRPAVVSLDGVDAIAIRHLMLMNLTYDHRWIDGHRAAQFSSRVKQILEEADFAHELGL